MVNAHKESLLCFGREQDLKEREGNRPTDVCPLYYPSFFFCFLSYLFLSFSCFLFIFFFLLHNTLCFFPLFSWHGKGPFIVPAVTSFLPLCPLTAFVWSRRTCQPPKDSSVCHSPLLDKGRFVSFVSLP